MHSLQPRLILWNKQHYTANVGAAWISTTSDSKSAQWHLIEWEKGQKAERTAECNHSSTSEQQCDRSIFCKPSGLVIIAWTQRRAGWCQGALRHTHCQFMNTRFVSEHKDLSKQFPYWPDSSNFTSASVLQPFLLCSHLHTYTSF